MFNYDNFEGVASSQPEKEAELGGFIRGVPLYLTQRQIEEEVRTFRLSVEMFIVKGVRRASESGII